MTERRNIEILGKQWQLVWVPVLKGKLGCTDHDHLRIELEQGHPDERMIATVLHEALEALNRELVLKIDHDTIERLETAWFAFLKAQRIDMKGLIWEDGA